MIVHLSPLGLAILQMIVASVLPIVVAFVVDSRASSAFKTWTLIVLAALADVATSILATPEFEVKQVVLSFFGILFAAISAHKGVTSNPIVGVPLSGSQSPVANSGFELGAPDTRQP